MEKRNLMHDICLDEKNIHTLVDAIRRDVRLSERSIPKCASMISDIMKKNLDKLSRQPKSTEELKEIIKYLNKLCITTMVEIIAKKYPNLHIARKKQVSKEQMKRELEVWGDRETHVQDRPYIKSRKEYDDDETFYNMRPNDIGMPGTGDQSGYASAFGNHLITNVPTGQKQPQQPYNNPASQRDGQFEQRFQQFLVERNQGLGGAQKPPTPDFTLDGSGEKVRQEKMMRKIQSDPTAGNAMFAGMPNGMGMDDPYASLLGAGSPMGMGNQLMPMSSTNMMMDQFSMDNQSMKSVQLNTDLEKKLAERRAVDTETNQPVSGNGTFGNQTFGNQPNMMPNMPGMMSGMIPNMPGMMPNMPGMMPNMPGMMPNMPGMMPNMPGMMSNMPGMMSNMPGMMPNMPGMIPNMPMLRT